MSRSCLKKKVRLILNVILDLVYSKLVEMQLPYIGVVVTRLPKMATLIYAKHQY